MAVNADVISFKDATAVRVIDAHTYEVELQDDWCIGTGKSRRTISDVAIGSGIV